MAGKGNFTPDEWKTLLESVMMAGIAVTAADPSGLWGTLKESMASARAVMGAAHDPSATELVHALATEFETSEGRSTARDGLRTQLSGKRASDLLADRLSRLKEHRPRRVGGRVVRPNIEEPRRIATKSFCDRGGA